MSISSMSAEDLRSRLRERALKKRAQAFENFKKLHNMNATLGSHDTIGDSRESTELVITERDDEGRVKSFTDGSVKFEVIARDEKGNIKSFKAAARTAEEVQ